MTEFQPVTASEAVRRQNLHEPGEILDSKFKLVRLLGQGGQTSVWLAEQSAMERQVAIKFLHSHKSEDSRAISRFLQEAKVLTSLKHPNIVEVYAAGATTLGEPYIVMELAPGESLASILRHEHHLPIEPARMIFLAVARALKYAHDRGIVHRDIKPANVMVANLKSDRPEVKLIDFGLVKLLSDSFPDLQKLTQTGLIMGSCNYMSPEQCTGQSVDARSDIYSLGCLMYEVLSGQTVFNEESPLATLNKHMSATAPPLAGHEATRNLPPFMVQIIHQALEKDPSLRQTSMLSLEQQLEDTQGAPGLGRKWKRKMRGLLPFTAAAALATVTTLALMWSWQWQNRTSSGARQAYAPPAVPVEILGTPERAWHRAEALLGLRSKSNKERAIGVLKAGLAMCPKDSTSHYQNYVKANLLVTLGDVYCSDQLPAGLPLMQEGLAIMASSRKNFPERYIRMREMFSRQLALPASEKYNMETLKFGAAYPQIDLSATHFQLGELRLNMALEASGAERQHYIDMARENWQYIIRQWQLGRSRVHVNQAYFGLARSEEVAATLVRTPAAIKSHEDQAITDLTRIFEIEDPDNEDFTAHLTAAVEISKIYEHRGQVTEAQQAYERIFAIPEYEREVDPAKTIIALRSYEAFLKRNGKKEDARLETEMAKQKNVLER